VKYEGEGGEWVDVPLPKAFVYRDFGLASRHWKSSNVRGKSDFSGTSRAVSFDTAGEKVGFVDNARASSDFALLEMSGLHGGFNNGYYDFDLRRCVAVQYIAPDREIFEECEVQILTGSPTGPVCGHLLRGTARIIVPGRVMCTRRIQIDGDFKACKLN
jgi:hypothetical protein